MEIKELLKISKIITEFGNRTSYWNDISLLNSNIQQYNQQRQQNPGNNPQYRSTITQTVNQIIIKLTQFQSELNTLSEFKTFKLLKLDEIFGEIAITKLQNLLVEINSSSLSNPINSEVSRILSASTQFNQLYQNLNIVFKSVELGEEKNDENEFVLYFENASNIQTLKELSKASNDWQQIVNCLSRLVRDSDTDTRIISVKRGSLILTIGAIPPIIFALTKVSNSVLDLILKYYEVKKKALELKKLNLSTIDDAIIILEKQAKLNVISEANVITNQLLEDYKWNEAEEIFNETKTAVTQAVRKIIRFTNAGGKIETKIINASNDQNKEIKELKEKTKKFITAETEVHKLEGIKELLQLEDKTKVEDE